MLLNSSAKWLLCALVLAAMASVNVASAEDKVLNLANWAGYVGKNTIPNFEKETGITVKYDAFDSEETLQSKLLVGNSKYDIVVPAIFFTKNQLAAGVFQKIDKSKIPNWDNLDPALLAKMAAIDPGNQYLVPWQVGTDGLAINEVAIKEILGAEAPMNSLALLFDVKYVSKLKKCGVALLDSPVDVLAMAMSYLGKNVLKPTPADIQAAMDVVKQIRPYVTQISNSAVTNDLVGGDVCLALAWSNDALRAKRLAREANKKSVQLQYIVPKEGSAVWVDVLAVPLGAPHFDAAMAWINNSLNPAVSQDITANLSGPSGIKRTLLGNISPELAEQFDGVEKHPIVPGYAPDMLRTMNRFWLSFKSGR